MQDEERLCDIRIQDSILQTAIEDVYLCRSLRTSKLSPFGTCYARPRGTSSSYVGYKDARNGSWQSQGYGSMAGYCFGSQFNALLCVRGSKPVLKAVLLIGYYRVSLTRTTLSEVAGLG